jgi:hypothetical protein
MKNLVSFVLAALLSTLLGGHAFATQISVTYDVNVDFAGALGSGMMTLTGDDTAPALGTYSFTDVSGSGGATFVGTWASANFEYVPAQGLGQFLIKGQNQNGLFVLSYSVPSGLSVFQALQDTTLNSAVTLTPVPDICATILLLGSSACLLWVIRKSVFVNGGAPTVKSGGLG